MTSIGKEYFKKHSELNLDTCKIKINSLHLPSKVEYKLHFICFIVISHYHCSSTFVRIKLTWLVFFWFFFPTINMWIFQKIPHIKRGQFGELTRLGPLKLQCWVTFGLCFWGSYSEFSHTQQTLNQGLLCLFFSYKLFSVLSFQPKSQLCTYTMVCL